MVIWKYSKLAKTWIPTMIRMRDRHIIMWDDDGGIWAAGVSYVISNGKKII
jgi:hypothetical protein